MEKPSPPKWDLIGYDEVRPKRFKPVVGSCFVYLIAPRDYDVGDPVKIGIAVNPTSRLKALRVASHHDLCVYSTWEFADQESAGNFETELHAWFCDYHIRGEWFRAPGAFIRLVGDLMLKGQSDLVSQIFDHIEDADLSDYLGDPKSEEANMRGAVELGYPDQDALEDWEPDEDTDAPPERPAPPPYVEPTGTGHKAILAAYKEARGIPH